MVARSEVGTVASVGVLRCCASDQLRRRAIDPPLATLATNQPRKWRSRARVQPTVAASHHHRHYPRFLAGTMPAWNSAV